MLWLILNAKKPYHSSFTKLIRLVRVVVDFFCFRWNGQTSPPNGVWVWPDITT